MCHWVLTRLYSTTSAAAPPEITFQIDVWSREPGFPKRMIAEAVA